MIRPGDTCEADELRDGLTRFEEEHEPLLGLNEQSREVFVAQLIESLRRVRYRNHYEIQSIDSIWILRMGISTL